jgi:hypothetical protein
MEDTGHITKDGGVEYIVREVADPKSPLQRRRLRDPAPSGIHSKYAPLGTKLLENADPDSPIRDAVYRKLRLTAAAPTSTRLAVPTSFIK